jgi:hypothetical protein
MKKIAEWQKLSTQIQQEWQANKRLQLIAGIAAGLFIIWIHVQLDSWRETRKASAEAAHVELMDMQRAAREQFWPERAAEAEAVLQLATQQLWRARSEGEAQATLRDWLERQAREQGLVIDRISVDIDSTRTGAKYRAARVDIQGSYKPGAWQEFLQVVSSHSPRVVVEFEQLNLASPRNQRYRLNVTGWFEIGDGATP